MLLLLNIILYLFELPETIETLSLIAFFSSSCEPVMDAASDFA